MTDSPVVSPDATKLNDRAWRSLVSSVDGSSPEHERYAAALARFAVPHLPEASRPFGEALLAGLEGYLDRIGVPSPALAAARDTAEAAALPDDTLLVDVVLAASRMRIREATAAAADVLGTRTVLEFVLEEIFQNPRSLPSNDFAVDLVLAGADPGRTLRAARQYRLALGDPFPVSDAFVSALRRSVDLRSVRVTALRDAREVCGELSGPAEEVFYQLVLDGIECEHALELAPVLV